jgi:hypothetical protein
MKNIATLLPLCLICLLTGCAKYYYQESKTFEECKKDRIDCAVELKARMSTTDTPGSYEYKFIEECMKSKGYGLVKENQLPLDVKRLDPDSSLQGQLYGARRGIAGTLSNK